MFQSIIGLRYRSEHAPHALSVLVAAPVRAGQPEGQPCDAASIQVHPSQLPCGQISAALEKSAQGQNPAQPAASADLSGLPLVQTGNATRVALIPVKPQGCIVVGVGVYYAR
ncbi:MAG: hypothetical protein FJX29_00660 [Alphaproteobacteria bacterium]|nr:hypothetical protein [Alphaproteobacteria bacterium]